MIQAAWGEYFAAQQNWPKAIERYRQAIKLAPDETLYKHQLAVALVKSGAVNEGFSEFVAVVGQPEAHYNVGVLLYQQGRLVEAEEHIQRAALMKPELKPAHNMLAKIQRERGLSSGAAIAAKSGSAPAGSAPNPVPDNITSAGWTAAPASQVQAAAFTTPTAQQLDQWRNQQGR